MERIDINESERDGDGHNKNKTTVLMVDGDELPELYFGKIRGNSSSDMIIIMTENVMRRTTSQRQTTPSI